MTKKQNNKWQPNTVHALFEKPFLELLFQAHTVHLKHFPNPEIQLSTLINLKQGGCPEDCGYCSQSGHHKTKTENTPFLTQDKILEKATKAKSQGATRFCMGAAWRSPPKKNWPDVLQTIQKIKALGLETCVTLGMIDHNQAKELKSAGLDYYNHNLDTSENYYAKIISTRTYQDRLNTLSAIQEAGLKTCCGAILGMGESRQDRIDLLCTLSNLPHIPESIPFNRLIKTPGTPLENTADLDNFEFIRTLAIARILIPKTMIRLSAGRETMSDEMQAWCYFAGANSIFVGQTLLTQPNLSREHDMMLLQKLGLKPISI